MGAGASLFVRLKSLPLIFPREGTKLSPLHCWQQDCVVLGCMGSGALGLGPCVFSRSFTVSFCGNTITQPNCLHCSFVWFKDFLGHSYWYNDTNTRSCPYWKILSNKATAFLASVNQNTVSSLCHLSSSGSARGLWSPILQGSEWRSLAQLLVWPSWSAILGSSHSSWLGEQYSLDF
jgi:hypothetical protein